jgi:hypothetical protein
MAHVAVMALLPLILEPEIEVPDCQLFSIMA